MYSSRHSWGVKSRADGIQKSWNGRFLTSPFYQSLFVYILREGSDDPEKVSGKEQLARESNRGLTWKDQNWLPFIQMTHLGTIIHSVLDTLIFFASCFPLLPLQWGGGRRVCSHCLWLLGRANENRCYCSMYPNFMYPMNYKFRMPLLRNSGNVKKTFRKID